MNAHSGIYKSEKREKQREKNKRQKLMRGNRSVMVLADAAERRNDRIRKGASK